MIHSKRYPQNDTLKIIPFFEIILKQAFCRDQFTVRYFFSDETQLKNGKMAAVYLVS